MGRYIQQHIPAPNRVHTFTIRDMAGGLNNNSSDLKINESSDSINMSFTDEVVMEKRVGTEYFDAVTLTDEVVFIDEYKPYTGADVLIRASKSEVYAGSTKIANIAGEISGTNYMGNYFFVDGVSTRLYGVFPQASIPPYTIVVGTPSPTPVVMKLVTPPFYTPLDTSHVQGVWQYNYATNEAWYEPNQNEIADTTKGMNVVPTSAKFVQVRLDRLYMSGVENSNDNVYISDIANGFYFPIFLPIQMPPNSDEIKGINTFMDTTVVGRGDDMHVIYGNTNRTSLSAQLFILKQINSHTGFANNEAIDHAHNYLFYIGNDGNAYQMHTTETDVKQVATSILNQAVDFTKAPLSISREEVLKSRSIFHDDKWYVAMGDKTMVYSYRHKAWTYYSYFGFNVTSFYVLNDSLIMGTNTGRMIQFKTNADAYADLDMPYLALWASKYIDLDIPSTYKYFREIYVVAKGFDFHETSDLNLKFEIDYTDVRDVSSVSNPISRWGVSLFGDRFINRNIIESLPVLIARRGRGIRVIYFNGYFVDNIVPDVSHLVAYPELKDGMLIYVSDEDVYYFYTNRQWLRRTITELTQPMCVYEVNVQYEMRGNR